MTVTTSPPPLLTGAPVSYRKNVTLLRASQLAALREAFRASMAINDDRGWQHWAGLHGLPLPMYCQHHTPLFLPWHRAYLYFFELTLKDLQPIVTLPWWDWTSARSHREGLPSAYAVETVDGEPNPLAGGPINEVARQQGGEGAPERTSRDPGDSRLLPIRNDVSALLDLGDFFDFQQQLEQYHDQIHIFVGGTVGEIPYAAYDPIFFAHHAMVDRIWRLWQLRHPTAVLPPELLTQALPPFPMTVAQTLNVSVLGYDYAAFSSRTRIGG